MQRRRRTFGTLAVCLLTAALAAAAHAAAPTPAIRPMFFEHLTMRDGLSMSTVNAVFQDSAGYLWIATESGLDRYDGYSIREYRRQRGDVHGLASDYIWAIAEDSRADLWLATDGGGVARWDRRTDRFEQYRHDPKNSLSLASDAVRALLIDAQGRIWAGTKDQGLDMLDPSSGAVRHFRHRAGDAHSLADDAVGALYADRSGLIWVGTDAGLCRYDPATGGFQTIALTAASAQAPSASAAAGDDQRVRTIREDHTGMLWIGTVSGGLIRLEPDSGRVRVFRHDAGRAGSISEDHVWAVLEDDAHRLWVATADGLNLFDPATESFVRYGHDADNPQSLRDNDVLSLYQDRGGVLWVGTRGGGASHWNPRSWLLGHYYSAAFRATAVSSFADDAAGKVWVGTIGSGVVEIDVRTGRERRYRAGEGAVRLSDDRVMALMYDAHGALWIGTMAGGLDRLDLTTGKMAVYRHSAHDADSLPADGVMSLLQDRLGLLWVGTFGGGVASIDRTTGQVTRYPFGDAGAGALSGPRASAIAEDALGNLWIGTAGSGLNLLDRRSGRFYRYRKVDRDPASLSDDSVYALHASRNGDVWVGTAGGGLDRVVGSSANPAAVRFENQSGLHGVSSQVVYGIESDRADRLWLSTNNGLARFDPRSHAIKLFHQVHGLQDEEFNFNAHYQGSDGTLFFGGNNGFNAFSPDVITLDAPPPRVVLTDAATLNRPIAAQDFPSALKPLKLGYDDKLVTLDFAALDFTSPANNRYSYQLEGFDSDWIDAGPLHRATYTNLDGGDYTFKVRAANADGVWSAAALTIPVHVTSAPWKTPAAIVVYAMLVLLGLGYLWHLQRLRRDREKRYNRELKQTVQLRTHELEERNQQLQVLSRAKSDFLARMSHELRTPMNGVLGMTSLLLDTRIDPAQRRFAEAIHRSADSLLAIVDDVLDFSKIEAGRLQLDPVDCDLVEVVEQTVEMLAARAATKGIELLCDVPAAPLPRVRADVVRLRQVLVNLGGNAVKFTERGEVILRVVPFASAGGQLSIRVDVADTGVGIAPENQSRIFEEFTQEDASTTRRFGGTGLGLAISRQIVELMGGELKLSSVPGVGSTFSFDLTMPLSQLGAEAPAPRRSLDGLRVLVVHENAAARTLILRALRDWSARPTQAVSLAAALEACASTAFDAVVIDDWLVTEGAQQWKALRARQPAGLRAVRLLSFVTLTASSAAETGLFDMELTKPLRLADLHRMLTGCNTEDTVTFNTAGMQQPAMSLAPLNGRVLVVEDQPLNREVAVGILTSLGLQADTANDGRQALEALRTGRFDLVLMDCEMPVMDGFSATAAVRRGESGGGRLAIIALTADATPAGREACLSAGMDDYLAKPFRREALHAMLSRWLPGAAAPLLDGAVLDSLRALPKSGTKDMLEHIGELYLSDSTSLTSAIETALAESSAADLARAAHAWRSYNGNVGAHGLAQLCRELEDAARRADFEAAGEIYVSIRAMHERVRHELKFAMRRSA